MQLGILLFILFIYFHITHVLYVSTFKEYNEKKYMVLDPVKVLPRGLKKLYVINYYKSLINKCNRITV